MTNWKYTAVTLPSKGLSSQAGEGSEMDCRIKGVSTGSLPRPPSLSCLWASDPALLAAKFIRSQSAKGDPPRASIMNHSNSPGKFLCFFGILKSYLRRNFDSSEKVKKFVRMETSPKSSLIHGILTYLSYIMLKSYGAGWHGKSRGI